MFHVAITVKSKSHEIVSFLHELLRNPLQRKKTWKLVTIAKMHLPI